MYGFCSANCARPDVLGRRARFAEQRERFRVTLGELTAEGFAFAHTAEGCDRFPGKRIGGRRSGRWRSGRRHCGRNWPSFGGGGLKAMYHRQAGAQMTGLRRAATMVRFDYEVVRVAEVDQ